MNAQKMRVLCLYAQPYQMEDGSNEGISLYYLAVDELTPSNTDYGGFGSQPAKSKVSYDKTDKLIYFPALYDLTLGMTVKKGAPMMTVKDLDFVSCVELKEVTPNAATVRRDTLQGEKQEPPKQEAGNK